MTTLRDMQLFAKVVQCGSFSAAGRHLGLSPASVSRHMNTLENALGVRLLNRTSRKLAITEAGELYFHRVEQILHDVQDIHEAVSQLQRVARGTLRVHSRMLVGIQYIVPGLPAFMARYPEIKVDLMLSNYAVDLVEQNVDVDVRIGSLTDSWLIARKLTSSERMLCAAPSYIDRHPPIERPEDLEHHNCLTYRINLGRPSWRFLDAAGQLTEVAVTGTYQSDNGQAILIATLEGVGISMMPDWAIADHLAQGRLRRILPDYRTSHVEFENGVYAVYQQNRHLSAKVRLFIDFLVDLFKERRERTNGQAAFHDVHRTSSTAAP